MKYLIVFLFVPLAFGQEVDPRHHLLWEISGNGIKKPSYIFGSFHHNDRRLFRFTDSTYVALNNSDAIVLEANVFDLFADWDTRLEPVKLRFDNQGKPYTWSSESTLTLYGDENGMPQFLDAYFEQYCFNSGKEFYALEQEEGEVDLLSNIEFSDPSPSRLKSLLVSQEDILETYVRGDIYRVDELTHLNLSLTEGLYESLILARNRSMTLGLDSLLRKGEGSFFCAVGAGHLAGTRGMLNLLRNHGFKVRRVTATYTDGLSLDRLQVSRHRYYTYKNDSAQFSVQFPGKPAEYNDEFGGSHLIYRDFGQGNTYEIDAIPRNDESSLEEYADIYIASPVESPRYKVQLANGGDAYEGISDAYPEGFSWVRVLVGPYHVIVLKAYGGNKFMNSSRAQRFFDTTGFF